MNRKNLILILKNLGRLIFIALPCFFLLVWIQAIINGAEGRFELGYVIETGAFYYLAVILYVAMGGLFHALIILFLPNSWSHLFRRFVVFFLTPIIPISLIILGERLETITDFLVPVILMLCIYGFIFNLEEPAT